MGTLGTGQLRRPAEVPANDPTFCGTREGIGMNNSDSGNVTGTSDKDYNLLWYTQACLENALRLEQYCSDAESAGDEELADLFRRAQSDSRKGAELGKQLLSARLGA
jgi:hypothetical protein